MYTNLDNTETLEQLFLTTTAKLKKWKEIDPFVETDVGFSLSPQLDDDGNLVWCLSVFAEELFPLGQQEFFASTAEDVLLLVSIEINDLLSRKIFIDTLKNFE